MNCSLLIVFCWFYQKIAYNFIIYGRTMVRDRRKFLWVLLNSLGLNTFMKVKVHSLNAYQLK